MDKHLPGVAWRLVAEAKVLLIRFVQDEANKLTLKHHDRTYNIKFDAYPKLDQALREQWELTFPRGDKRKAPEEEGKSTEAAKSKKSAKSAKATRPFGHGILNVD